MIALTLYICILNVGAEWWAQDFRKSLPIFSWIPLPFPETPLYVIVLVLMVLFAVVPTVRSNIRNVSAVVEARKGSMELALAMILPFIALLFGVTVWCYLSPSDIMRNQPHLLVIGTGFNFGYLVVSSLLLALLLDYLKLTYIVKKNSISNSLVFLPLALANALIAKINDGNPLVDEVVFLILYCAYTVGLYLYLAVSVVHEIKDALGIYCFRITRKEA
ncbi:hypothetical protein PR202_ga17832 [Eleusine coracana subsp. coracana]|uniref:Uncharacterized protein n=1 Tax=Eleusine coracana subsp. coracana TaxID=191504 RepID=A0AAV5CRG2_ELECO|nr:hypothetical protein PR202_ga17832 [Eleusine coracana subsp. coracana]